MDANTVISFENISVRYRVPRESVSGLKEYAIRWAQRRLMYEDFWALRDVSFDVRRGETFGVIGRNGSGKSTLLKVSARVLHPTQGSLQLRGRVAPLLELGAGFHLELTGRENVYLNSALLGRTRRQVDSLFQSIIDFSEIGDFIDSPLRTYSTGMVTRLGFAVATAVRPQILLVDEVLSVGDMAFQQKCMDRMYEYREQGSTILFVSHSIASVEALCDRAVWLANGKVRALGDVAEVTGRYLNFTRDIEQAESKPEMTSPPAVPTLETIQPVAEEDYYALPETGCLYPAEPVLNIRHGTLTFWLRFNKAQNPHTAMIFHTDDSRYVIFAYVEVTENGQRIRRLGARAGGNRQAYNPLYGGISFPEVTARFDEPGPGWLSFPYDEWQLVSMTWDGYPNGQVHLYIGEVLVGEAIYDYQHDNHSLLAEEIAVGLRPPHWKGELIERQSGDFLELRPRSLMTLQGSGIEVRDVRLYQRSFSSEDILAQVQTNITPST